MQNAEFDAFTRLVDRVLSVPREEFNKREAEYKNQSAANPSKRGPKPKAKRKVKPSAS